MRRGESEWQYWGRVVETGFQILAVTLCALILANMAIEDAQAPRTAVSNCHDYGTK